MIQSRNLIFAFPSSYHHQTHLLSHTEVFLKDVWAYLSTETWCGQWWSGGTPDPQKPGRYQPVAIARAADCSLSLICCSGCGVAQQRLNSGYKQDIRNERRWPAHCWKKITEIINCVTLVPVSVHALCFLYRLATGIYVLTKNWGMSVWKIKTITHFWH